MSFEGQIMFKGKYPCVFARQMEGAPEYIWGGYVPPGTPNLDSILKRICPKILYPVLGKGQFLSYFFVKRKIIMIT